MDKFALQCAIRHVYFNDFGLDKTFLLGDLSALFLYYMDEDTSELLIDEYRKLHKWLVKHEFIKKYVCPELPRFPKDYNFTFNGSRTPDMKFCPNIEISEDGSNTLSFSQINDFANELDDINIPAIALYVKNRIRQGGDLDFVEKDIDACRPQF